MMAPPLPLRRVVGLKLDEDSSAQTGLWQVWQEWQDTVRPKRSSKKDLRSGSCEPEHIRRLCCRLTVTLTGTATGSGTLAQDDHTFGSHFYDLALTHYPFYLHLLPSQWVVSCLRYLLSDLEVLLGSHIPPLPRLSSLVIVGQSLSYPTGGVSVTEV